MNQIKQHKELVASNIANLGKNIDAQSLSRVWSRETNRNGYTYNFSWQGRPIIQYPQDMVAMQELIWQIKPDLIIETGLRTEVRSSLAHHNWRSSTSATPLKRAPCLTPKTRNVKCWASILTSASIIARRSRPTPWPRASR